MSTLAIIAEYNPYTGGHEYLLSEAKQLTGADTSLAVMGGNFLQRGTPAMWDKYTRAKAACLCGVDCVLELPLPYATGSARDFAFGAVSLLDRLSCTDYLCFGAEASDLAELQEIADMLAEEPAEFKTQLNRTLKEGLSFPAAREEALSHFIKAFSQDDAQAQNALHELLSSPNNILAIEYLTALKKLGSEIKPVMIPRKKSAYHDETAAGSLSSATALRTTYLKDGSFESLRGLLPQPAYEFLITKDKVSAPITKTGLTPFLQQALLTEKNPENIYGINEFTANKIKKQSAATDYDSMVSALHTKDVTESSVARGLLHLILNYTKADKEAFTAAGTALYANLLAFHSNSTSLLKKIQTEGSIPLINLKKNAVEQLQKTAHPAAALRMWNLDTRATDLYNCLVKNSFSTELPGDLTYKLECINY